MSLPSRTRTTAVAILLALAVSACANSDPDSATDHPVPGEPATPAAAASVSEVCAAAEFPQRQAGSHLMGDTAPPVPYSSTPATSGWHASGRFEPGVLTDTIDDPDLVSIVEVGGVVAVYDPDALPADDLDRLIAAAEGPYAQRLTVAPYAGELSTPLALVAWGVLQRCDAVDVDAVAAFVLEHHGVAG